MPIYSATTTLPDQARAERLAEAVEALDPAPYGIGVFEVEDGSGLYEIGAHFEEVPDDIGLSLLAAAFGARAFAVSEVPEKDWVAHVRRELAPVEAGRFFVYGAHDADKVPDDRVALLIEASMAFGTGHHGTTMGCLLATETLVQEGVGPRNIIDVGCGTAVLAMAAARVWPDATILASDIDDVAVDVARANVAANGLETRIACHAAAGFDAPALTDAGPYGLVYANILKGPLMALAPQLGRHLSPGGHAILSGILNEQADAIEANYSRFGVNPVSRTRIGDWTTLILRRSD